MKAAGKKVVLYHMGDELADKNIAAYNACDLIIRNYFFPEILNRPEVAHKILWAPNGCKTGVSPRAPYSIQKVASRQYLSCFLGWLSNTASFNGERSLFSEAAMAWSGSKKRRTKNLIHWLKHYLSLSKEYLSFSRVAPHCKEDLHLLSSNGFSNGYNVGLYSATMEDSVFAPCPAGNSPETIRLYDALESGCIPVSLKHEFLTSPNALGEFGAPPFIILSSWNQFPEFLGEMKQKMLTNPEDIQKMQQDCITWWGNYKNNIAQKIAKRIESLN
ncbi:exostosin family protein [Polynucleobacter paneuropaeus]|nr:exostosin family protein [Polynucleobacter paneuropaeus]QWD46240.1 exostosin family protein [Polynucleobacter paneuropaeus]